MSSETRSSKLAFLPQLVTLTGIFFGALAIIYSTHDTYLACVFVMFSAICDLIDGRVARWTNSVSRFGQELDSLADIVSFGLAPVIIVYFWLRPVSVSTEPQVWLITCLFFFTAAGAVRLARFNLESSQRATEPVPEKTASSPTESARNKLPYFMGLPIPAAAMIFLTWIMTHTEWSQRDLEIPLKGDPQMLALAFLLGGLMVSRVPFRSYKAFRSSVTRAIFFLSILGGLTSVAIGQPGGTVLLLVMLLYLLAGLWQGARLLFTNSAAPTAE